MSTTNTKPRYWFGSEPEHCDVCNEPIGTDVGSTFIDGATHTGPWALMCPICFYKGIGIGILGGGCGQKYMKQEDGKWLKVEG